MVREGIKLLTHPSEFKDVSHNPDWVTQIDPARRVDVGGRYQRHIRRQGLGIACHLRGALTPESIDPNDGVPPLASPCRILRRKYDIKC
jgi:hypothetical protein